MNQLFNCKNIKWNGTEYTELPEDDFDLLNDECEKDEYEKDESEEDEDYVDKTCEAIDE